MNHLLLYAEKNKLTLPKSVLHLVSSLFDSIVADQNRFGADHPLEKNDPGYDKK